MFNKFNFRSLVVIFSVLLIIVVAVKVLEQTGKKYKGTIPDKLIAINTMDITAISIQPPSADAKAIRLHKFENKWFVEKGDQQYFADPSKIKQLKALLAEIEEPKRVVARKKERWDEYDVSDSAGIKIALEKDGKVSDRITIGRFNYQQPTPQQQRMKQYGGRPRGSVTSYIRVNEDKRVYVVDGFLRMAFQPNLAVYRDKTVVNSSPDKWSSLSFIYPADSSFTLSKRNGKWLINNQPVDSDSVDQYLQKLSDLSSQSFLEPELKPQASVSHKMIIKGKNMNSIEVTAKPVEGKAQYAIQTSQNKEALFADKQLFNKIFISPQKLKP